MSERINKLDSNPFLDGPAEFLVKSIAQRLLAVPQFAKIFGDSIDCYKRMDYSIRGLPAMRVYNNQFVKDYESWFINGSVTLDLILPASLRRQELQQVQDTLSAAVVQQFRRPGFFAALEGDVPGLNELGKRVEVDKSLGFEWGEQIVPLTQITLNFRLDLRKWDDYLEAQNRTKDSPFEETLGDLEKLYGVIEGLKSDSSQVQVAVETDFNLEDL